MNVATLHRMSWGDAPDKDPQLLLTREWLVTNGLGGYASGTLSGACTRRSHGLLIAALAAPWGRHMAWHHLAESVQTPAGATLPLGGCAQLEETIETLVDDSLTEFRLESGLPIWRYEGAGIALEKRIVMPHMQNTVHVFYRLLGGDHPVQLQLRPAFHFRAHEGKVAPAVDQACPVQIDGDRIMIVAQHAPPVCLRVSGGAATFVDDEPRSVAMEYAVEQARGYDYRGSAWSPGYLQVELAPGQTVALTASTEDWDTILAVAPTAALEAELQRRETLIRQAHPAAQRGFGAQLALAADQFIIRPNSRVADTVRAHASGDHARTIIAGYPWFTDWGRDTMISLEGLTLVTGRYDEAGALLRTFARYVRDGLVPNLFPEGSTEAVYHTADASLWYFHALSRYLAATNDQATLQTVLPALVEIVERHLQGTRFGIHVDPHDGLLVQGAAGYQLTWMDAKVGDWVVTPRRGKAVEINALWHNSLCLLAEWQAAAGAMEQAAELNAHAQRAKQSFNERFWSEGTGCLFDVVDGEQGDDASRRPNQLLAISLDHPVLDRRRWEAVVRSVEQTLLTPYGLRTLSRDHPDYQPAYEGDLRARDAAYHQGTVWPWLLGPFVDAWLKVYPERQAAARDFLAPLAQHLGEAGMGTISEIFDAEAPYLPRGCVAQGWSVAETLRAWVKLHDTTTPLPATPGKT